MTRVLFTARRYPVAVRLRPHLRVAQTLFVAELCGRGGKAHLLVFHLFDAALNWEDVSSLTDVDSLGTVRLRYDPSLNVALGLAVAWGLFSRSTTNPVFALTEAGMKASRALGQAGALKDEREFLARVGKKASFERVSKMLKVVA